MDEEDRHPEVKLVLDRMDGDTTGWLDCLASCAVAYRPWRRKQQRRLSVIQVDDRSAQLLLTLHSIWQAVLARDDTAADRCHPVMWQALMMSLLTDGHCSRAMRERMAFGFNDD